MADAPPDAPPGLAVNGAEVSAAAGDWDGSDDERPQGWPCALWLGRSVAQPAPSRWLTPLGGVHAGQRSDPHTASFPALDGPQRAGARHKVALPPGHTQMDWMRLTNSGKDLRVRGPQFHRSLRRSTAAH